MPTTKLVSDMVSMQACYVNPTHPDFLNGHKVRLFPSLYSLSILLVCKAMSLITDRLNANKPATSETKQGKLTPAQLNNNKDMEVDMKKEEPSFFGSFFSSSKSQEQKAEKSPAGNGGGKYFLFLGCAVTCHSVLKPVRRSEQKSSARPLPHTMRSRQVNTYSLQCCSSTRISTL